MIKFTVKAVFYTAIVWAFAPASFKAPLDGAFAAQAEQVVIAFNGEGALDNTLAQVNVSEACETRAELCETASELGTFARWAGGILASEAEEALEDHFSGDHIAEARSEADALFAAIEADIAARD